MKRYTVNKPYRNKYLFYAYVYALLSCVRSFLHRNFFSHFRLVLRTAVDPNQTLPSSQDEPTLSDAGSPGLSVLSPINTPACHRPTSITWKSPYGMKGPKDRHHIFLPQALYRHLTTTTTRIHCLHNSHWSLERHLPRRNCRHPDVHKNLVYNATADPWCLFYDANVLHIHPWELTQLSCTLL